MTLLLTERGPFRWMIWPDVTVGYGADHHMNPLGIVAQPSVGNPALGQVHALAPSGISAAPSVGSPALTETTALSPNGISVSPSVGAPALSQVHSLAPSGISVAPSVGNPALSENGTEEITFGTATYNRNSDGTNPTLAIPDVVAAGFSGGTFTLYIATRDSGDAQLSKSDIENGTGDAIDSFSIGPEADILDLDAAALDLTTSLSSDNIDFFYEHSGGTSSDVGTVGSVTYDAVAPVITWATNAAGTQVIGTADKNAFFETDLADWSVDGSTTGTLSVSAISGSGTTTITLTLSGGPLVTGETITLDYTNSDTDLRNLDGEVMADLTDASVTNSVSASNTISSVTGSPTEESSGGNDIYVWEGTPGSYAFDADFSGTMNYEILGGGGPGGDDTGTSGGGGGGGRRKTGSFSVVSGQTYTVTVGAEGEASGITVGTNAPGTADGGGDGGDGGANGGNGGHGGGAGGGTQTGGTTTDGGNAGGDTLGDGEGAGGGGEAGDGDDHAGSPTYNGGDGADGVTTAIPGRSSVHGAGGGGGGGPTGGAGGSSVGGDGPAWGGGNGGDASGRGNGGGGASGSSATGGAGTPGHVAIWFIP